MTCICNFKSFIRSFRKRANGLFPPFDVWKESQNIVHLIYHLFRTGKKKTVARPQFKPLFWHLPFSMITYLNSPLTLLISDHEEIDICRCMSEQSYVIILAKCFVFSSVVAILVQFLENIVWIKYLIFFCQKQNRTRLVYCVLSTTACKLIYLTIVRRVGGCGHCSIACVDLLSN